MVRRSGFATSRKIPFRPHLATVKEKKKNNNVLMSDTYIFQLRNILQEIQERKEVRTQEPKKEGDQL